MKIGIATFQWADNYGAVIQAHALQFFLKKMGHEVEIINYQPKSKSTGVRQYLAKTPTQFLLKWEAVFKRKTFERFRKQKMKRTRGILRSSSDLKEYRDYFDILITGSDQVWNPKWLIQQEGLWDLCFLRFAGIQTRKISYAASFGHSDISTMNTEWQDSIRNDLTSFYAISVREQSGLSIVHSLTNRTDAVFVIDPTLLFERSYFDDLIGFSKIKKSYLFCYILHGLEQDSSFIKQHLSESLKLKTLNCDGKKSRLHKDYVLPNPIKWLQLIRDASFMLTNSFHGVVFCLIFHTPFIVCLINGEIGTMNSRIFDLLSYVGLSSRIINPEQTQMSEVYKEEIDWNYIDNKIDIIRKKSTDFLILNTH